MAGFFVFLYGNFGGNKTIRNLNYTIPIHRPFWGRMVSFTPIPSTGVKDTTPVYKPFWGRHVLFKFQMNALFRIL